MQSIKRKTDEANTTERKGFNLLKEKKLGYFSICYPSPHFWKNTVFEILRLSSLVLLVTAALKRR
jgi:hypothetical protein